MSAPSIVTSASDIAAILDTVAPDAGTPLADTPIWNELEPEWKAMQARFRDWEAETGNAPEAVPPVQAGEDPPAPKPRPRNSSRKAPSKGSAGSSTRRAANTSQTPTEKVSVGPEAEPEEAP